MSLVEVGLKVTFSVLFSEPEVVAMIHLYLIRGHIMVFKRVQDCSNRLSHLREKDVRRGAHTYTHMHTHRALIRISIRARLSHDSSFRILKDDSTMAWYSERRFDRGDSSMAWYDLPFCSS